MMLQRFWFPAGVGLAVTMAGAGWAWRDCLILASSMVLAYRLFLLHMDRGAPWRALTAAVNALSAAMAASVAGVALIAGICAAWLGWWQPRPDHSALLPMMLCAGAALCCSARGSLGEAAQELQLWLWLLGGVLLAWEAQREGMSFAPCLVVVVVGLAMLRAGWRLATETGSGLLRAGSEWS